MVKGWKKEESNRNDTGGPGKEDNKRRRGNQGERPGSESGGAKTKKK
jgi:hypothetical protein